MRMRIRKIIPQGQEAYEVQRDMFFHGEVVGEGGGWRVSIYIYQFIQDRSFFIQNTVIQD